MISTLETIEPIDLSVAFDADRLAVRVELARVTGRGFGEARGPLRDVRALGPVFFEREWSGYEAYMARCRAATLLPAAERQASFESILKDLRRSWLYMAQVALPNLAGSGDHADGMRAFLALTRLLAAAHLHRLETGEFPAEGAALARFLGGALPADPFEPGGAPLAYRLEGGEVRCWSVGRNLLDDGGEGRWSKPKDLVLITSLPSNE